MTKPSKRVLSKQRLQQAFLQLLASKTIEEITIKEITDLAGFNRGTFYCYYTDIYDLHQHVIGEYINYFEDELKVTLSYVLTHNTITLNLSPLDFIIAHKKALQILLKDPDFLAQIKARMIEHLIDQLQLPPKNHDIALDYALEYAISGQITLLSYWLNNDLNLSTESFFNLVKTLLFKGPATTLLSYATKNTPS